MRILITRPRDDAMRLAQRLTAAGHDVLCEPMLEIRFLVGAELDLTGAQAILFTSANGVRAFAAASPRRDMAVFAVGDSTAAAARDAGFGDVESAGGAVDDLARLVRERLRPEDGPVLHVSGRDVAGDLSGRLSQAGFTVRRAVLYAADGATSLSSAAGDALRSGSVDAAVFYSARTAATFRRLVEQADLTSALAKMSAYGLSPAALEPIRSLAWARQAAAAHPDESELLTLIEQQAAERPRAATERRRTSRVRLPPLSAPRGLTLMVWLAVLLSLGTFALQVTQPGRPAGESGAAGALRLDSRIGNLERQVAAAPRPAAGAPQTDGRLKELSDRIAALESRAAAAAGDVDRMTALTRRIDDLEKRPAEAPAAAQALAGRVDELERNLAAHPDPGQVAALMADNRRLADEVARLQQEMSNLDANRDKTAGREAVLLAVGQLAAVAARGEAVAAQVRTLRELAGDDTHVAAALAELVPIAGRAVPTIGDLHDRFSAVATAAVRAADGTEPVHGGESAAAVWWRDVMHRLGSVVTVRRVGDVSGDAPDARIARAEQRLAAHDLAGAVQALSGLSGAAAQVAGPWLADAQARLTLDHAVDDLTAAAISAAGASR
jgi:uroporphyrinogen-III synthase